MLSATTGLAKWDEAVFGSAYDRVGQGNLRGA
jgi:hypothetical protein